MDFTQEQILDFGKYSSQLAHCCDWSELMERMPRIAQKIRDLPSDAEAQEIFASWHRFYGAASMSHDILYRNYSGTIQAIRETMKILRFFEMNFPEPPESIREIVSPQ